MTYVGDLWIWLLNPCENNLCWFFNFYFFRKPGKDQLFEWQCLHDHRCRFKMSLFTERKWILRPTGMYSRQEMSNRRHCNVGCNFWNLPSRWKVQLFCSYDDFLSLNYLVNIVFKKINKKIMRVCLTNTFHLTNKNLCAW